MFFYYYEEDSKAAAEVLSYLTMLIWKSSSARLFHAPDRKSRHQANALARVSRSTSSVLPFRKDSASESSSQLAPNNGLAVLNFFSLMTSVFSALFFSAGGSLSSAVLVGMVPISFAWSTKPRSSLPQPLFIMFPPDCMMNFWAKSRGQAG